MTRTPNRKGQAAMEFIMTYGWAIMVLLAMIAALAYFGVLNPNKFLPDKCLFPAGFNCQDFQSTSSAGVLRLQFSIENKNKDNIIIQNITATYNQGSSQFSKLCTGTYPTAAVTVDSSYTATCDIAGASVPSAGSAVRYSVFISYKELMGVFNHSVTGEIAAKQQ